MLMTYVSHRPARDGFRTIITVEVEWTTGMLWWKEHHKEERDYIGNGTVWRTFPNFSRCSTPQESVLSDMLARINYQEDVK